MNNRPVFATDIEGPCELGRQESLDEKPFSKRIIAASGRTRAVIAEKEEDSISRRHLVIEPLEEGRVRMSNASRSVPVRVAEGETAVADRLIPPTASIDIWLPVTILVGKKLVRFVIPGQDDSETLDVESLPNLTLPPGTSGLGGSSPVTLAQAIPTEPGAGVEVEQLLHWLQTTMNVLQSAASSSDFMHKATQAAVEIVGLDSAEMLLHREGAWVEVGGQVSIRARFDSSRAARERLLERMRHEHRTLWHTPKGVNLDSTMGPVTLGGDAMAAVASPVLDVQGRVIGALYGERRRVDLPGELPKINRLEAMLIELLASGVAAGLARQEKETAALAAEERFKQFFTPQLARLLAANPDLLTGRESEISILFADIRGFSRLANRLTPAETVRWINQVMEALSDCVLAQEGVLVDYIGDELIAMWGAPEPQPNHAERAVAAALAMLEALPGLNERWERVLGEPMELGIGINSGIAQVGNMGSARKFKYGPLGGTVNLASRVQGVTKYLRTQLLATEATWDRLGASKTGRRIGKVRMVNIAEPVELFELASASQPGFAQLRAGYESALVEFERKGFREASTILGALLPAFPDDGPSLVLLSRVVSCRVDPEAFDAAFTPGGK